jgi:hypothetical protein
LYSSLIDEWRRTRDAGLLTGKPTAPITRYGCTFRTGPRPGLSGVSQATAHRRSYTLIGHIDDLEEDR